MILYGTRSGMPTCAGTDTTYTINVTTGAGAETLRLILAAKAAGWNMNLYGKGTCTNNTYQEDLDYAQTVN
jgi:hypothetical protein